MARSYPMEWRRVDDPLKTVFEWKPQNKRPRARPRKIWIDGVIEDLSAMDVENWLKVVQDREKLRVIVMTAKALRE